MIQFLLTKSIFFTLAASSEISTSTLELSYPESSFGFFAAVVGAILLLAFIVWLYLRDTRDYSWWWRAWLMTLRISAVVVLLIIALNPHIRTEKTSYRPSRVVIAIDTSTSMEMPDRTPTAGDTVAELDTRATAIRKVLMDSDLIAELRKKHDVQIFTFNKNLEGNQVTFGSLDPRMKNRYSKGKKPEDEEKDVLLTKEKWDEILSPRGSETRLGDSLGDLIIQSAGSTLAGIIPISDGQLTAGMDVATINQRAKDNKVRIYAIGVGGTTPDANVEVLELVAPKDVQVGDAFDMEASIQGRGLIGKPLTVELLAKVSGDETATVIESREIILNADNTPMKLIFTQKPEAPNETAYTVRVKPPSGVYELRTNDNERSKTVVADDEPTRVLLIAGTPKRDYRFLRNVLYRHKSVKVDVWLQSTEEGISQESDEILFDFPEKKSDLFEYDVIVTFDADWELISPEGRKNLEEWVFKKGGGFIFVAGEVFTPQLASTPDDFPAITTLLPVELESLVLDLRSRKQSIQPWAVQWTTDGRQKPFFQITDEAISSQEAWEELPGIFRVYPTVGAKNSTVYAYHGDESVDGDERILLAGQSCNKGFSIYIGSAELYRLRAFDDQYFDRFWTAMIRELAKQRRGQASRAEFVDFPTSTPLGQTVNVRVRLSNSEYKPHVMDAVECFVTKPNGSPMSPPLMLLKHRSPKRAGEYQIGFRPPSSGQYRLRIAVPDSDEFTEKIIEIKSSQAENAKTIQNVKLLRDLTVDTGGQYIPLQELSKTLPKLLPNKGEEFKISERLRTLWDRQWVLLLLAFLLSAEWLTRKLLQLA